MNFAPYINPFVFPWPFVLARVCSRTRFLRNSEHSFSYVATSCKFGFWSGTRVEGRDGQICAVWAPLRCPPEGLLDSSHPYGRRSVQRQRVRLLRVAVPPQPGPSCSRQLPVHSDSQLHTGTRTPPPPCPTTTPVINWMVYPCEYCSILHGELT